MHETPPSRGARITRLLTERFAPDHLRVTDESHRHAGHAGATAAGETHYAVAMVAAAFQGASRLARARAVHAALAPEFGSGLHALSLSLQAPAEAPP